jgi:hypothetical protein
MRARPGRDDQHPAQHPTRAGFAWPVILMLLVSGRADDQKGGVGGMPAPVRTSAAPTSTGATASRSNGASFTAWGTSACGTPLSHWLLPTETLFHSVWTDRAASPWSASSVNTPATLAGIARRGWDWPEAETKLSIWFDFTCPYVHAAAV